MLMMLMMMMIMNSGYSFPGHNVDGIPFKGIFVVGRQVGFSNQKFCIRI